MNGEEDVNLHEFEGRIAAKVDALTERVRESIGEVREFRGEIREEVSAIRERVEAGERRCADHRVEIEARLRNGGNGRGKRVLQLSLAGGAGAALVEAIRAIVALVRPS